VTRPDRHDQNEATGTQSKPTGFTKGRPQPGTERAPQAEPGLSEAGEQGSDEQQIGGHPPAAPRSSGEHSG